MPDISDEQRKALEEKIKNMSPEELKEFQKQQCIFCQIIAGKIPSKKVYEDDRCITVLDINPATRGHLLIIPKEHYAIMPQIPDKDIGHFFLVSKYLSQVLLKVLKASGTNVFVANGLAAGQRSQHFMVHVIPRKESDGLLQVQEKVYPADIPLKVKQVVELRLNELLGIKKEPVQKTIPEAAPLSKSLVPASPTAPPASEKEPEDLGSRLPPRREERQEAAPDQASFPSSGDLDEKQAKKKSRRKKKTDGDGEEGEFHSSSESGSHEGVSLDDIANLFK